MRRAAALALCLVGASACAADDAGGVVDAGSGASADAFVRPDDELCRMLCSTGAQLGCQPLVAADCVGGCLQLVVVCGDVGRGFNECAARQPETSWECRPPVGLPTIKDGVCAAEDQAVARCVQMRP